MGDPRALIGRLTAAQNAHDLEALLSCFHEDYRSEQPLFPARTFVGIDQVRANWSALLDAMPDFHAEVLRSAADGDVVFAEVHWTGTKADGTPLDERGVIVMGIVDDRIAWSRLYVDEVERDGADIDTVVRQMAGTPEEICEFAFPGPLRDRLVAAVLSGEKTATSSLLVEWELEGTPIPAPGLLQTVIDSDGRPVGVIETLSAEVIRLGDADLRLAVDEGEGFESVAHWRAAHERFWLEEVLPTLPVDTVVLSDDTQIVVQRFRLAT